MNLSLLSMILFLVTGTYSQTTELPNEIFSTVPNSLVEPVKEEVKEEPHQMDLIPTIDATAPNPTIETITPQEVTDPIVVHHNPSPIPLETVKPILPVIHEPVKPVWSPQVPPSHFPSIRQTGPIFNPFRPSMIRSLQPNIIPLPMRDQPVFEVGAHHNCAESQSRRDIEKRSPFLRHLESFYLSPKNHDVRFSVCGTLLSGHLILIESISPSFEKVISSLKQPNTEDDLVVINDVVTLLDQWKKIDSNTSGTAILAEPRNKSSECEHKAEFETAFKIFLKYFYAGESAFDEINHLNIGFVVWQLGKTFLDQHIVQQWIEPKLGNLISISNISQVYRFARQHHIDTLLDKWSEFVSFNAKQLTESNQLPLSCDEINSDYEFLDRFIESLKVNQSVAIAYIGQYINKCSEDLNLTIAGVNQFPRSLLFFRCTIDDLKELIKMKFITYENLSEELENRLRAQERQCEEKCVSKFVLPNGINMGLNHRYISRPNQTFAPQVNQMATSHIPSRRA